MTKQDKLNAALTTAARKQPDPVKRGKILKKIEEIKRRINNNNWLAQ